MSVRLIIVEDHPVVRKGLERFLSFDPEIEIVGIATNGLDGVELTRKLKPDVVLTNFLMPIMDGMVLTRIVKQEMPQIRIIFLSLNSDQNLATKALLEGADAFFVKGHNIDDLGRVIKGDLTQIR